MEKVSAEYNVDKNKIITIELKKEIIKIHKRGVCVVDLTTQ